MFNVLSPLASVTGGTDDALPSGEPAGDDPPMLRPGGVRDVLGQREGVQEQAGQFRCLSHCL